MINLFAKPNLVLRKVLYKPFSTCLLMGSISTASAQETEVSQENLVQGGRFSVGSSYGALNGIPLQHDPYTILYSEGSLNLSIKRLPFKANYYISNASEYGGRRNSFSIQFDAPKLKQIRANRIAELKQKLSVNVDSLMNVRHELGSKIAYYQFSDQFYHAPDSLNLSSPTPPDSIPAVSTQPDLPSLPKDLPQDSLNQWLDKYHKISTTIEEYKKYQAEWDQIQKTPKVDVPKWKEAFRLQNLKSLQFGAASPDYSPLTVQGNRIVGIAISTEAENLHVDFAAGFLRSSYSNVPSRASILGQVLPLEMFNAPSGRLIAARIGYGSSNSSHIYLGYTGGKNNIIEDLFSGESRQRRSQVLDVSGQLSKGAHLIDVTLAQRLNSGNSGPLESDASPPISKWFHSALSFNHSSEFEKLSTKIENKVSWIGPGYFSIGAPFLLSDNARIESKISNHTFRYFQPSLSFKHQFNDVLDLFEYDNQISIAGIEINSKLLQSLTLRVFAGPAISKISNSQVNVTTKNYVYQVGSTFMRQANKFNYTIQLSAGRNLQLWDTLFLNSDQATVVLGLSTKAGFTSTLSVLHNRFDQNGIELINFTMLDWQFGLPIGKGITVISGLSILKESSIDLGAFGQMKIALGKSFEWTIEARQFVWPTFNADFAPLTGIRIPYLLNTSIQYTIK